MTITPNAKQMIMRKITFKNHLNHLLPYIFFLFISVFLLLYLWANQIENKSPEYLVYIFLGLTSILNIYIHFEYYFTNNGVKLLYNKEKHSIIYKKKHHEDIIISPETIIKIEIYQSRLYNKNGFLITDKYRFYKFILEGNRNIIITSLLYPNFEYTLEGVTETKERVIASILFG